MDDPSHYDDTSRDSSTAPRIVLVDQHAILRDGLRAILHTNHSFEVIGEAESLIAAQRVVDLTRPNLVITDIDLKNNSAGSLVSWLKRSHPEIKVLVLAGDFSQESVRTALDAGAEGYILKDANKAELLRAIRSVLAGKQFVSSEVAARVLTGMFGRRPRRLRNQMRPLLTARERQILKMIALADSTKAIASRLNLSVKTVEKHRANLMKKLELKNSAAVTLYAVRHGLIPVDIPNDVSALS